MTLYELCLEYLDALNLMASQGSKVFLYEHQKEEYLKSSLADAINIRTKIADTLECDINRLIMITDALDVAIDFVPSMERYDRTKVYAQNLECLLICTAGRAFLSGETHRLTTVHGTIEDTRPLTV